MCRPGMELREHILHPALLVVWAMVWVLQKHKMKLEKSHGMVRERELGFVCRLLGAALEAK